MLRKSIEGGASSGLDRKGSERLIDNQHSIGATFEVISTDECGDVNTMLQEKAAFQKNDMNKEMIIQKDAFHKLKNAKKDRKGTLVDSRHQVQRMYVELKDLKKDGLIQLALQHRIEIEDILKRKRDACRSRN